MSAAFNNLPSPAQKDRFGALLAFVWSDKPDLTRRQMTVMMAIAWTPGPHTIRGLADRLKVHKPVISRAINTLQGLGFVIRVPDMADRRNVFLALTRDGFDFLGKAWAT